MQENSPLPVKIDANFTQEELKMLPKTAMTLLCIAAKRAGGVLTISAAELEAINGWELKFLKRPDIMSVQVLAINRNKVIEMPQREEQGPETA